MYSLLKRSRLVLGSVFVFVTALSSAQTPALDRSRTLVLTNATLLDGTDTPPRTGMTLVIDGDLITTVSRTTPTDLPDTATVVDLRGRVVLPGLGEGHTHLATNPSAPGYRDRVEQQLRTLLGHGITHLRDLGGDGRVLAFLARQTSLGEVVGPDIYYSSLLAGPDYFRDPRIQAASRGATLGHSPWAHEITDTTDLNDLMAQVVGIGASGVKVYANVTPAQLARIVEAAHTHGLKVWSHWVLRPGQTTALDAVRAGVDVVSHAYMPMLDATPGARAATASVLAAEGPDLMAEMRERGTILDPTLYAAANLPTREGWVTPLAFSVDIIRLARAAGIPIVTGSDHGGTETLPGVHFEYRALEHDAGLTVSEIVTAATSVSALAVGIDHTDGVIAAGKRATLLILDTTTLDRVQQLATPQFVIKRGTIFSGDNLRNTADPVVPLQSLPQLPAPGVARQQ